MENLVEIGANLSVFLASSSPQVKEGFLKWYLSGSLATITMASAETITEIQLDENNRIIREKEEKNITNLQREKMSKFSRKLGTDIDIVNISGDMYSDVPRDKKPHINKIKENVPNVLDLMNWPSTLGGNMYLDRLEGERKITNHSVAKVKTKKGEVYMTAPPEQLAHKLNETIIYREIMNKKQYEKDIKDFSSMFYGFQELYEKEEFLDRVYVALNEKDNSKFISSNSLEGEIEKIKQDSLDYLDTIADEDSKENINDFLSSLVNRMKQEKNKLKEKTPLQQREEQLSKLEATAKEYSKIEALQNRLIQKEGQSIGE